LSPYTGPSTITTAGTVIDSKTVTGHLDIKAPNVVIRNSRIGTLESSGAGTLTLTDVSADGGTYDGSVIYGDNITARRVEVTGARQSVSCTNCDIEDSWMHGQYLLPGSSWHVNGYISNGGNNVVLRHNTIACDVQTQGDGGCTGPVAFFGDFSSLDNYVLDHNLIVANNTAAYCLYAGYDASKPYGSNPTNIRITNNVFQHGPTPGKCAYFGAITSFKSGNGNEMTGNVWDTGEPVR